MVLVAKTCCSPAAFLSAPFSSATSGWLWFYIHIILIEPGMGSRHCNSQKPDEEEENRMLPTLTALAMNPASSTDPRKSAKPGVLPRCKPRAGKTKKQQQRNKKA